MLHWKEGFWGNMEIKLEHPLLVEGGGGPSSQSDESTPDTCSFKVCAGRTICIVESNKEKSFESDKHIISYGHKWSALLTVIAFEHIILVPL